MADGLSLVVFSLFEPLYLFQSLKSNQAPWLASVRFVFVSSSSDRVALNGDDLRSSAFTGLPGIKLIDGGRPSKGQHSSFGLLLLLLLLSLLLFSLFAAPSQCWLSLDCFVLQLADEETQVEPDDKTSAAGRRCRRHLWLKLFVVAL